LWKIGITNKNAEKRHGYHEFFHVLGRWQFDRGRDAYDMEQLILNHFSEHRYKGDRVLVRRGNTELFTQDILGLDPLSNETPHALVSAIVENATEIAD
jgi:hypothetical protein